MAAFADIEKREKQEFADVHYQKIILELREEVKWLRNKVRNFQRKVRRKKEIIKKREGTDDAPQDENDGVIGDTGDGELHRQEDEMRAQIRSMEKAHQEEIEALRKKNEELSSQAKFLKDQEDEMRGQLRLMEKVHQEEVQALRTKNEKLSSQMKFLKDKVNDASAPSVLISFFWR